MNIKNKKLQKEENAISFLNFLWRLTIKWNARAKEEGEEELKKNEKARNKLYSQGFLHWKKFPWLP